jgi:hypothetical protein
MSSTKLNAIRLIRSKVVKKETTEWRTESADVPLFVDLRSEADQSKRDKRALCCSVNSPSPIRYELTV